MCGRNHAIYKFTGQDNRTEYFKRITICNLTIPNLKNYNEDQQWNLSTKVDKVKRMRKVNYS